LLVVFDLIFIIDDSLPFVADDLYMHLYFARSRQSTNKQAKNKHKHIATEIYNTMPAARLRIHYSNMDD